MSAIRRAVERYLELRRSLGFKLEVQGFLLRDFATWCERHRASHLTVESALRWAQRPERVRPQQWARRLAVVRRFAIHLSASDRHTEIPPPDLLPYRPVRAVPHIYSEAEIRRLLQAARRLRSSSGLRAATYTTLLGLLVVSGLRIGEAVALDEPADVDLRSGVLTIRRAKFGKTRLVPLHASSTRALRGYLRIRDRVRASRPTPALFVGEHGQRLSTWSVRRTFNQLSREIGLRDPDARRGPRLHDFRHRLAVTTLLRWYRRGVDVERHLPRLVAFLGHGHLADTYWYLSAMPELMRCAAARLESLQETSP